jgi:hypothetical protein
VYFWPEQQQVQLLSARLLAHPLTEHIQRNRAFLAFGPEQHQAEVCLKSSVFSWKFFLFGRQEQLRPSASGG